MSGFEIKKKKDFYMHDCFFIFEDSCVGYVIDGNSVRHAFLENDSIVFDLVMKTVIVRNTDYNYSEYERYIALCES